MEQIDLINIHHKLADNLNKYIEAIIEKYGDFIPPYKLKELKAIEDYESIIKIYNTGSINAYANNKEITMPLCANKILSFFSMIPGYGINKNHKNYNDNSLLKNNNTYINYMFHTFISGTNAEGYYDDMLLHETMHFCGSGGATALKEGINELLTRKIALEKGFRTSGCGYPKEVKIAVKLQSILGEDIINQVAFINSEQEIYKFLATYNNIEIAELYLNISQEMEKVFNEKYYASLDSYNGITGIIKKTINYRKINYNNVYKMIEKYEVKQNIKEEIIGKSI